MTNKLNELFTKIRQQNLKEEFQVGQAALALKELKNSVRQFSEFLDGPFTEGFKTMHNDPRNIEEGLEPLAASLRQQQESLAGVIEEMDAYLDEIGQTLNPQSLSHGAHHEDRQKHRFARWENKPARHTERDGEV